MLLLAAMLQVIIRSATETVVTIVDAAPRGG
jgi:hypothetical protein